MYRVTLVVEYLGWVDLDLGSSRGWWAATVSTYCPSRMVEHLNLTQPNQVAHLTPQTVPLIILILGSHFTLKKQ